MGFKKAEIDRLLAETGRRCCLCRQRRQVQVHHIVPTEQGGSDEIDNAIPLCPNCHDEVHGGYSSGRTTRSYSPEELKLHRQETIALVRSETQWAPGSEGWQEDKELILFYAQCLDRPAFRTHFHNELSFADFDRAMEDTLLALNTGYWRTRDGTVIDRSKGKVHLINSEWRRKVDQVAEIVEEVRRRFKEALGLDEMLFRLDYLPMRGMHRMMEHRFRGNLELGQWMDERRNQAVELINSLLRELGHSDIASIR